MSALEHNYPTLDDLKFEVGQVLVISHWRRYIKMTYPTQAQELLEPVENVARVRNFLAHCINSLHADPWTEGSAVIACAAPDGTLHSFSIDDLRAVSTQISKLMVTPICC